MLFIQSPKMITWLSIHSSNTRLVTKECCAEYELIFNGPSLSPSPPPPPRLWSAPASSLVSCLHCHPCNSTLPWSRENNESEAQLIGFLTLTCSPGAGRKMILKHSRSCCSPASEPSVPNLLGEISQNTDMKIMREGMRTLQERKKKAI